MTNSNYDLNVQSITNGSFGELNVTKLSGANYADIATKLDGVYSLKYNFNGVEDLNVIDHKAVKLGVYFKRTSDMSPGKNSFLLFSIPATISVDANKKVTLVVQENGSVTPARMYFTTEAKDPIVDLSAADTSSWTKTSTLNNSTNGNNYTTLKVGSIINQFINETDANGGITDTIKKDIFNTATKVGTYNMGLFLSPDAFTTTGVEGDAINFTNDNESISLFNELNISSTSDTATEIKNDFGMTGTTVKGYTGILNVQ